VKEAALAKEKAEAQKKAHEKAAKEAKAKALAQKEKAAKKKHHHKHHHQVKNLIEVNADDFDGIGQLQRFVDHSGDDADKYDAADRFKMS
jgi:hypothetical protein